MWLLIATLAQIILGTSAVFDKVLLRRALFDPWVYTFWTMVLALAGLLVIPFGTLRASFYALGLALAAGAIFSIALWLFFLALSRGQASVVQPITVAFAQVSTLLFSLLLLGSTLGSAALIAFLLLAGGGLLFVKIESREIRLMLMASVGASAALFGLSNVLAKMAFEGSSFVAGFAWMRIGGLLAVLPPLALPSVRSRVVSSLRRSAPGYWRWYVANRAYASLGGLLIPLAIFLAHPALVDATSSVKFVVTFGAAWLLLSERFRGKEFVLKTLGSLVIISGMALLLLTQYASSIPVDPNRPITWGVTFSSKFSKQLGLDWQKNFEQCR